jgi:hypothetical protein
MIAEHGRIGCGVRYRLEGQAALIEIYAERLGCPEQSFLPASAMSEKKRTNLLLCD